MTFGAVGSAFDRIPPGAWRAARIAGLVALTVIVAASLRNVDWTRTGVALHDARPGWLVVAVAANAAILACWAAFWRVLRPRDERRVSYGRMLEITSMASSLMNTLPFGGGHASSVLLLIRRGETTQRGALSTLALDQLGEGIVKVMILFVAGIAVTLPTWMRAALTTISLGVAAWLVALLIAARFTRELEILKSARRSLIALGCVAAMKGAEFLAIASVQTAYGVHISAGGTLLVLATVILATMLPISPGNLGAYEASVFFVYQYLGLSPELALSLAIVQHVCFMLPAVGVGYLFVSVNALSRNAIASR
jgi:uncharacterized membrane protein YbhN (UPF0104 family)